MSSAFSVFAAGVVAVMASGCSYDEGEQEPPTEQSKAISIELFVTRSSLQDTEYEQYKLMPIGVYVECGKLKRGRSFAEAQGVHDIVPEARAKVEMAAKNIFDRMSAPDRPALSAPGTNADMFDPGKFLLTLRVDGRSLSAPTSFDEVERGEAGVARTMKGLLEKLRSVSDTAPCGNEDFYGVRRVPR